jgi:uncharacterized repeat protein (TIGR01451 family)
MSSNTRHVGLCGLLLTLGLTVIALGQEETAGPLDIRTVAEVESRSIHDGHEALRLIPADRVVPGDHVIYTLEVRNISGAAVDAPLVTERIPAHMRYVAESAVGPGAEVSYSVDGGHRFAAAENLEVRGVDGRPRPAVAADYTHIRWRLKNGLKANSVAFVRFRALVQ